MKFVTQYLNFNGNAEEAFEFYRSVFGGEFTGVLRFRDFGDDGMEVPGSRSRQDRPHLAPIVGGIDLMASDVVGEQAAAFNAGNNFYVYLETDSADEADRLFAGAVRRWNRRDAAAANRPGRRSTGSCVDKFGIQWMISYTGDVQFSF